MAESKKDGLPRIVERRLRTEGRSASFRSNQPHKFTFNLKTEQANEYLRSWLNREDESRKMQKILKDNLQQKHPFARPAAKSVNKTSTTLKNELYPELADNEFIEAHLPKGNTSSMVIGKQKPHIPPDQIQVYYHLQLMNREPDREKLRVFRELLEQSNPLFQKLSTVIGESLLRIGTIAAYQPSEFVYKQGFAVRSIGVLLWGEAVLRCRRSKARYSCLPGSTIGEELVFEDVDYASKKYSTVEKGELCSKQRCKAASSCGILFVGAREFGYMLEDLVKWGFREETMRFRNILHRMYLKKREFRSSIF